MDLQKNIEEFIKKVNLGKQGKLDLSADEDLSIGIMNLISIEEHLYFTGVKTGKAEYFETLNQVRSMRKELLKKIIKEYEGEIWCTSKHLLAASMRLMEVGTKQLGQGNKKEAEDLFYKAYDLYSLFWALNLKIIGKDEGRKVSEAELAKYKKEMQGEDLRIANKNQSVKSEIKLSKKTEKKGFFGNLRQLVRKAIDCCIE